MENEEAVIRETEDNSLLVKTFFWMFLGILASAFTAWYGYSSGLFLEMVISGKYVMFAIAEIVVVLLFSFLFRRLSPTMVGVLYAVYSMLNGFTLAVIFYAYELSSIIYILFGTSALFAILALYGYKTKSDLSKWGPILSIALLVGIVLTIINLILGLEGLDILLTWVMLFVFVGLTIYDMNKFKMMQEDSELNQGKLHIYCAMELYLDFINIFLRLLALFAKRRD